jgi:hypothetical protein
VCNGPRTSGFFGLFPSSGILATRRHDVSETGSLSVLRCGGGGRQVIEISSV